ncbi:MAG: NAD-dependent epimerase/dehydratase family protein [Candidatus Babeliales bacterium]
MFKTLITGCTGFVGSNLISYLQKQAGYEITGVRRNVDASHGALPAGISLIAYPDLLQETSAGWNSYIHLAGMAHDVKGTSEDEAYFEVNFELTKQVFQRFLQDEEAGTFVILSSMKAVADKPEGVVGEDMAPQPATAYGKSKLMAEEYVLEHEREGKRVFVLRPCMIHGPGNKGNLNLLYALIRRGIPWPLGSFDNRRSFLSIDNLNFVIHEILSGRLSPGVYHVCDDEPLSTNELVSLIAKTTEKSGRILSTPKWLIHSIAKAGHVLPLPLDQERLQKLTESYVVSNAKLKKALGKELPVNVRDGLTRTFRSFND